MEVRFRTRHVDVGDVFRLSVEEKLAKATNVMDSVGSVDVELTEHQSRRADQKYRIEINTFVHGQFVRIASESSSAESALDDAADRFSTKLRRLKERMIDGSRKHPVNRSASSLEVEPSEIVRVKRFAMKPMSVEEAALQMDMLGHAFFLFLNEATDKQSVLYQRADGRLGMIEPG